MPTIAPSVAPVDFKARLTSCLTKIQCPSLYDSAWLGSFEQLVGAGFSLIESEERGFSRREYSPVYHPAVQRQIVSLLVELAAGEQCSDEEALENWLSRYYFNSGIQRVTFAAERLIATFAALPCRCGSRPPEVATENNRPPKFSKRLDGACARLAHVQAEYPLPLTKFKTMLDQLGSRYNRNDFYDSSKGLAMIRQDVNSRKHSVYIRSETLDALPRPASGTITWSNAGCHDRMATAIGCLELVAGAYAELLSWNPSAKL